MTPVEFDQTEQMVRTALSVAALAIRQHVCASPKMAQA
ncbi:hypothetical protein EPIB2_577 [Tritonibacter mobilis]|nr:hypothetical protein EPIB2_577 [Tritonibacter mobilis]